ncbi:MAG TPA: T9SS type A sorting domain-containing protein, partial [Candidatus Kapabacteria bacterium]|nr:T9SS type A sorting domain-containing protein [Candidatus Kapabacteria bacterium]
SPDGSDSVARFTKENSPLVDDRIASIAIDPTRGEAYAGTPAGISRFSTIFKQGHPDYSSIRVYPNPVVQTADFGGSPTIYIDGLVAGSTVQVFSLNGQLITTIDGTALGSTVTWNGRDALGRQVPSGMYLVSATSAQSGDNGEAKVVIVRKP